MGYGIQGAGRRMQGGRNFGMQSKNTLAIPALPLKTGAQDAMIKWGAGMPTMPTMPSDAQ